MLFHVCPCCRKYSMSGKCRACPANCLRCVGPADNQCTACPRGSFLFNGRCLKGACPDGYYANKKQCHRCHMSCAACTGTRCCLGEFISSELNIVKACCLILSRSFANSSVCLTVCLWPSVSVCPSAHPSSVCDLSVNIWYICLPSVMCPSVRPFVRLSVRPFVRSDGRTDGRTDVCTSVVC